jgi:hypothetical protein
MPAVTIIGGSSIAATPSGYAGQEPSHYLCSAHGSTNNVWRYCGLLPTVTGCARCITKRANNIGAAIGGCCNDLKPFKKKISGEFQSDLVKTVTKKNNKRKQYFWEK